MNGQMDVEMAHAFNCRFGNIIFTSKTNEKLQEEVIKVRLSFCEFPKRKNDFLCIDHFIDWIKIDKRQLRLIRSQMLQKIR